MRFDHPAPWEGCAYASAEPASRESLHGFLYALSGRDAAMDKARYLWSDALKELPMDEKHKKALKKHW